MNGTSVHVKQESLMPGEAVVPSVDLSAATASIKREMPDHPGAEYDDMDQDHADTVAAVYGMQLGSQQPDNVAEDLSVVTEHTDTGAMDA